MIDYKPMIKRAVNQYRVVPFKRPPTTLFRANLDNIAIVPASLLPFKNTWQQMANNLPKGSILICHSPTNAKQKKVLEDVEISFRARGRGVKNISTEDSLLTV